MSGRRSSLALTISTLALTGCAGTLSIPIEVEHTSTIEQHFDGGPRCNGQMCGWDTLSTGLKYQMKFVAVEVLDGLTDKQCNGRHESFEARISTEIPIARFP